MRRGTTDLDERRVVKIPAVLLPGRSENMCFRRAKELDAGVRVARAAA
jgi:hypothetical protein